MCELCRPVLPSRASEPSRLADWPTGRLADWPTGRLADWPTGRLADWPTGRLADWPTGRLADWPTGRLADWPTGLLRDAGCQGHSTARRLARRTLLGRDFRGSHGDDAWGHMWQRKVASSCQETLWVSTTQGQPPGADPPLHQELAGVSGGAPMASPDLPNLPQRLDQPIQLSVDAPVIRLAAAMAAARA